MSASPAEDALLAQIESLRSSIKPATDEIVRLQAEVASTETQIAQTEFALAALRGQVKPGTSAATKTGSTRGSQAIGATVDDLVRVLKDAAEPLTAGQIRSALDIPGEVKSIKMSQFLAKAVESGAVTKKGEKRATRYSAK